MPTTTDLKPNATEHSVKVNTQQRVSQQNQYSIINITIVKTINMSSIAGGIRPLLEAFQL